jgi:hypothetical protein
VLEAARGGDVDALRRLVVRALLKLKTLFKQTFSPP